MSSIFEPETRTVHVYRGDYQSRLARLEAQIMKAAQSSDGEVVLLHETPENERLRDEYEALAAEAADHRVDIVIRWLEWPEADALRAEHPPRVLGDEGVTELQARGDMVFGVNEETFRKALVRASIISPELTDDEFRKLPPGVMNTLYAEALDLTFGFSPDPKAVSLVSPQTRDDDAT